MTDTQFRSTTNPITNLTNLSEQDAQDQLMGLLTSGLRPESWASFVHEMTHHWCFSAPVGQALVMLHFRPLLKGGHYLFGSADVPISAIDEATRYEMGDDFLTYEICHKLLWPILEGLALFAEFDLIPSPRSAVYSYPLHWTLKLYGKNFLRSPTESETVADTTDRALWMFLADIRRSRQLVRRKASVLAQPLRTAREGYLGGYLMVKNLWVQLGLKDERLWDAELFMGFLYRYFLCDMALVARILEPDDNRTDRFQRVVNYFNDLMNRLVSEDITDLIDSVLAYNTTEPTASSADGSTYVLWASIESQKDAMLAVPITSHETGLWAQGIDLLVGEMMSLRQGASDNGTQPSSDVHHALQWLMTQRDLFCVISEQATVRVPRRGRVVAELGGSPVLASNMAGESDIAPGKYEGTIGGYLLPYRNTSFVCVAIGDRIVAITYPTEPPAQYAKQVLDYRMDGAALVQSLEEYRAAIREFVARDEVIKIYLTRTAESMTQWQKDMAVVHALPFVNPESRESVAAQLDIAGLSAVLKPAGRLRGLAAISLLSSLGITDETAALWFAESQDSHQCNDSYGDLKDHISSLGQSLLNDKVLFRRGEGTFSAV